MSESSSNELVSYDNSRKPPAKRRKNRTASLRKAMMAAVTEADVFEITKMLVFLARRGDPIATREVLDRVIGKPPCMDSVMAREAQETVVLMPGAVDAEILAMDATVPLMPSTPQPRGVG
jgi:hypothetical protein